MFCERLSPVSASHVRLKRSETSSWMRLIETSAASPCGKTSRRTSWASSTVIGRPVRDEKATTRVSAPSSSRMLVVDVDSVDLHLLTEDRDARLEVGRLDVGDQPPLEAAAQPLLERRNVARRTVARHDDLRAGLVQ